ncbi:UNVERIFIED_CONTAM: hypothetical protein K2H54_046533 [Gekko kuhli]
MAGDLREARLNDLPESAGVSVIREVGVKRKQVNKFNNWKDMLRSTCRIWRQSRSPAARRCGRSHRCGGTDCNPVISTQQRSVHIAAELDKSTTGFNKANRKNSYSLVMGEYLAQGQ